MIPTRFALRNRWWTLAWAAGIVWTAVTFAGGEGKRLTEAGSGANNAAQADNASAGDE